MNQTRNVFAPYGGNYPVMSSSQWENAPFNQREPEEKEFECNVIETLTRRTVITSSEYEVSTFDYDKLVLRKPEEEYKTKCFTVLELIAELKTRVSADLKSEKSPSKVSKLKRLLQACEGWNQYDIEIEEE